VAPLARALVAGRGGGSGCALRLDWSHGPKPTRADRPWRPGRSVRAFGKKPPWHGPAALLGPGDPFPDEPQSPPRSRLENPPIRKDPLHAAPIAG
jgi:hypothetical protein